MTRIGRIGLGRSTFSTLSELSRTVTSRGWPFNSKNTVRLPSGCGSPIGEKLDDQRLAGLELDGDLLAGLHAVVELRRRQHADVAIQLPRLGEGQEDLRIHQIAQQVRAADTSCPSLLSEHRRGFRQVDGRKMLPGTSGFRLLAAQHDFQPSSAASPRLVLRERRKTSRRQS